MPDPDLLAELDGMDCWCGMDPAECAEAGGCRWTRELAAQRDQIAKEIDTAPGAAEHASYQASEHGGVAELRDQLIEALTREHSRRARERIEASPEEHCAAFADVVLPVVAAMVERFRKASADIEDTAQVAIAAWRARAEAAEQAATEAKAALAEMTRCRDNALRQTADQPVVSQAMAETIRAKANLSSLQAFADRLRQKDDERHAALLTERDRLRARLTGVAVHANRLKTWITDDKASITIAGSIIGDLLAAIYSQASGEDPSWADLETTTRDHRADEIRRQGAAIQRVSAFLDALVDNGFGATHDSLRALRSVLGQPPAKEQDRETRERLLYELLDLAETPDPAGGSEKEDPR